MAFPASISILLKDKFSSAAKKIRSAQNLINREIETGTNSLTKYQLRMEAVSRLSGRLAKKNNEIGESFKGLKGEALALGGTILTAALPIKQALQFEAAMSDVRKVVDFDTPEQFKEFGDTITKMSTKIPLSAVALSDIAQAGGQFGVQRKDLQGFIKDVAKISVAWDVTSQEAGDSLAKLSSVLKMPISDVSIMADTINHLSNNMAATAPQITEVVLRSGQMGKTIRMSNAEISAMAGTLLSFGVSQERAGTSMNMMFARFADMASKDAGFAKAFGEDPQKAIIGYLEKLKKVGSVTKRLAIIKKQFGEEAARPINALVEGLDKYKGSLELVSEESKYLRSVQDEYKLRSETTGNELVLLKNKFVAVGQKIGTAFFPFLKALAAILGVVAMGLLGVIDALEPIMPMIAGLVGSIIVIKTLTLATKAFGLAMMFAKNSIKLTMLSMMRYTLLSKGMAAIIAVKTIAMNGFAAAMLLASRTPLWLAISAAVVSMGFLLERTLKLIDAFKSLGSAKISDGLRMMFGDKEQLSKDIFAEATANAAARQDERRAKLKELMSVDKNISGSVDTTITVKADQGTSVKSVQTKTAGMARESGINLAGAY